jgi:hypothetical protein
MSNVCQERKEEVVKLLENGLSRPKVCDLIGCTYKQLLYALILWNLIHLGNQGRASFERERKPIEHWLVLNGPKISSCRLKLLLWEFGLKEKKCEGCGITEWQGKPAPLELDHINGVKRDNRIDNLRILCPNCHAQTLTYCINNWKRRRL